MQLISLSQAAHKVSSGEFSVEEAIKTGKAYLVIIAGDASERTKKHFTDMCNYREIPVKYFSDKETLGHFIGKEFRATVSINDEGLSDKILSLMC